MISRGFRVHHEVLPPAGRGGGGAPPARPTAQTALAAHAQLGLRVLRDWKGRRLQRGVRKLASFAMFSARAGRWLHGSEVLVDIYNVVLNRPCKVEIPF